MNLNLAISVPGWVGSVQILVRCAGMTPYLKTLISSCISMKAKALSLALTQLSFPFPPGKQLGKLGPLHLMRLGRFGHPGFQYSRGLNGVALSLDSLPRFALPRTHTSQTKSSISFSLSLMINRCSAMPQGEKSKQIRFTVYSM